MHSEGDIINDFYNLNGEHINERKKNFYKLLKTSENSALLSVKPRNFLEKIFYLDILIYYRKTDKLLEILKEGNGVFTSRILKEKWFFQEVFEGRDEAEIVNIFLPTLSCSLRGKVLLKMAFSLTEKKMDKIVELLIQRYGIHVAQQILFGCSEDKIREIINNYDVRFDSVHLKRFLNKNPLLIKFYFERYREFQGKEYDNTDFLNYLCWKKPELYLEMEMDKKGVKLGKCTTKTLLKIKECDVINNEDLGQYKLHLGQFAKQITDFGKRCLPKLLPKNVDDFKRRATQQRLCKILIKFPRSKRWNVISEAFSLAYNKNIMDYIDYFQTNLISYFTIDIKRQWSTFMYSKTNEATYWIYLEPKHVFTMVKDKVNVTSSVHVRLEYLFELVNSCNINNDYNTYGELLKYVSQRHRNDDLRSILTGVNNNYNSGYFTDVHWKYVKEIMDIVRTKGSIIPTQIYFDYLRYLVKHEMPLDDLVKWFILDSVNCNGFDFKDIEPDVWKTIWSKIIEVTASIEVTKTREEALVKIINLINRFNKEKEHISLDLTQYEAVITLIRDACQIKERYTEQDYNIVIGLLTYNNQNPKTVIRVCDDDQLLKVLKLLSEQFDRNNLTDVVCDIIMKPNRTQFETSLLHYFVTDLFNKLPFYLKNQNKTMQYLIRNDPKIVNSYFDLFLKYDANENLFDFGLLKKYSHLGFDQKFINHHSGTLTDVSASEIDRIIKGLALLMPSDNFLSLVSQYLPEQTKLDLQDIKLKDTYHLQCKIIKRFQQVEEPVKVIPYLSSVCHDDYLQTSLPTIYNILNKIDEQTVCNFINTLKNQPLSLRKHAVFLAFNYMPLHFAMDVFTSISTKERNVSMKKHFLQSILKIFMKNPVKFILNLVLSKLDPLDSNDDESLEKLAETVANIPIQFRAIFIEKLWATLNRFPEDANKNRYRNTIIGEIRNCFCKVEFTDEFCKDVIRKYFLSMLGDSTTHCSHLNSIVIDYLRTNNSQRFDFIFGIIRTFKANNWTNPNKSTKRFVHNFFKTALYELTTCDINVVVKFEEYWKKTFSCTEYFSAFCSLEILKLFKDASGNIKLFAEGIDHYFQDLLISYGPHINLLLTHSLSLFCNVNNKMHHSLLENVVIDLLNINASPLNLFIGVNVAEKTDDNEKKNQIIQLISLHHDPLSEIFYHSLI